MDNVNLIVVRTLNYLRGIHLPTYVALRLMLNRVPPAAVDSFLDAVINQVTIRKLPRVLDLKRFKSMSGSGFVYRDYSIPSPTSALADSYAISVLHASGAVKRRGYVYSHLCPTESGYPKNFEHFSVGYGARNSAIAKALEDDRMAAVIVDIRNFYPSVDAHKSLSLLQARLDSVPGMGKRDRAVVLASAERAVAPINSDQKRGLRVGPDMSHVLADISLDEVDSSLVEKFKSGYFRYVDDIVAVVRKEDAESARAFIGEVISKAGHSISEEKDSVVDNSEWLGYKSVAKNLTSEVSSALNNLKFRSKLYLAKNPSHVGALKDALKEVGVYLPVDQLLDGSRQAAWRYRVSSLFSQQWRVVTSYWNDSLKDVVRAASACRAQVINDVDRVLRASVDSVNSKVSRKWQIQNARMAINRALYFVDNDILKSIENYAADISELAETAAVCGALLGDASRVVNMPGPAVSAFSQVAAVRGVEFPSLLSMSGAVSKDILADITAHFSLRGDTAMFYSPDLSPDFRGLAAFSAGSKNVEKAIFDGGYGAEVAALAINSSRHERMEAASTRFALREDVVLDALNLSVNYVS